jgi:hypothetical protein
LFVECGSVSLALKFNKRASLPATVEQGGLFARYLFAAVLGEHTERPQGFALPCSFKLLSVHRKRAVLQIRWRLSDTIGVGLQRL